MKTFQLLKPLPIKRDEKNHRYVDIETKQWMSYSTTEVCSELTEEDKENIEKWRSQWQPRGEKCHECLAEHMLGNGKIDPDEYGAWVEPLLQHELFTHFEPMAVEHMMSIPDKSVGGQLDLLGRDTKTNQIRLIDLKTRVAVIISCERERKMVCYTLRIWICIGKNLTQLINNLVATLKC